MKSHQTRSRVTIAIACLLIALTLNACAIVAPPENTEAAPEEANAEEIIELGPTPHITIGNNLFTLRYDPGSSLNPITCQSADNLLVTQLLYEGLFALDGTLTPQPVLCESIETEDNLEFTIKIKPDIVMSDASVLTAGDVAYTLNMARDRGRFASRLAGVESIRTSDGLTVIIKLKSPNTHFAKLLDIPIIKSNSIDYRVPPGSGPYAYAGGESTYMTRLTGHRDYDRLPISTIFLAECTSLELIEQFSDGLIDFLWDDPTDSVVFESSRQHDVRAYNTTTMQFIGFNTRQDAFKTPELRRAIGLVVDQTYIADTIMGGYALASPLAFSPAYPKYNERWERTRGDMLLEISEIISAIGLADDEDDNDSYLEFPVPGLGYEPLAIDFIVNTENSFKTRTAEHIADMLQYVGFNITVRELKWAEYTAALDAGDFDMYIGDVSLGADFDLSPLLLPGGSLDYGGIGNEFYEPYLTAYFTSGSDAAEIIAAKQLCDIIYDNAPFIPISYKKYVIRSCRGVISGASPSQSTVFFGITDWTIVPGTDIRTMPSDFS